MNYDVNIREEKFGATVLDLESGKRNYVTKSEIKKIMENGNFPKDLDWIKAGSKIKFTPILQSENIGNNFSFADIAYIELTRRCNLRCMHCLNNSGTEVDDVIGFNKMKDLILDFSNSGIQEIRFTGGEPLLYENLLEIIKLASDNRYICVDRN